MTFRVLKKFCNFAMQFVRLVSLLILFEMYPKLRLGVFLPAKRIYRAFENILNDLYDSMFRLSPLHCFAATCKYPTNGNEISRVWYSKKESSQTKLSSQHSTYFFFWLVKYNSDSLSRRAEQI